MFLRNFLLFSHVVKSWRSSSFAYNIRRFRRFNNSLYFKCDDDVERGLKHQYIENKAYNNNENEVKSNGSNKLVDDSGASNNSLYIVKAVSSLIVLSLASFIAFYMDNWIYGLISIYIGIITVLFITGKWRWFYIAAVTGPRDLK
jgi:hypothetical protein